MASQALYQTEEPSANDSVKAEPHSVVIGQEAPSLPDCVPLEIKSECILSVCKGRTCVSAEIYRNHLCSSICCPSPVLPPPCCSPSSDLHIAGYNACTAGEAAGSVPRCERHGHRTGRDGSPVLQGGSLPNVESVGRARVPGGRRRTRSNASLDIVAGAVR